MAFVISSHVGSNASEAARRSRVMYWTGADWSPDMVSAAWIVSKTRAMTLSRTLAREFRLHLAVNEVGNRLAIEAKRGRVARDRRDARIGNPVPLSRRASLNASRERFKDFRGDSPGSIRPVKIATPLSAMTVGELDGVMYTTVRDGNVEKYVHKFRKTSRPLLAASDDGTSLHIVGGRYAFTERGIVDT